MKVLPDECLPRKLKKEIIGHEVKTVPEMGWAGTKNGALLRLAETQFDVFITVDRNLQHQQNLSVKNLALVVLVAADNRLVTLRPLVPSLLTTLQTIQAGETTNITS